MQTMPIIRLEVERMKIAVATALTNYQAQFDQDLQIAVEQFCQPEHLRSVIKEAVDQSLKQAIESEIQTFFRYGAGRAAIAQAVLARLELTDERE